MANVELRGTVLRLCASVALCETSMLTEIFTQRHRGTEGLIRLWPAAIWAVVAFAGLGLSWDCGQLPTREATPPTRSEKAIAPDLALYWEMIARVRRGDEYYAAAREAIPSYGFPIASPLNWRLPTYAWLLSRLPCIGWVQLTL